MLPEIKYNEQKLTELILYVGAKCALDTHYGVLKLNKILFYSDFLAYRTLGKPITGAVYKKYDHGPAPHVMGSLRKRLVRDRLAYDYKNPLPYFDEDGEMLSESRLLPRRAPDMDKFAQAEVSIVDSVIERLRPLTGKAVSLRSHKHPGWAHAKMEEPIPYATELLGGECSPLSKKDMAHAMTIVTQHKRSRATAA